MVDVCRMRRVSRSSISENFQVATNAQIPGTPEGGARVKVHYAGACYTEDQILTSGRRPKSVGILTTCLFPGFEICGVVDDICNSVEADHHVKVGDRVVVYPSTDEETEQGFSEYIQVKNPANLVKIPDSLCPKVAATLASGGLTAYSTGCRIRPFVEDKIEQLKGKRPVHILIAGAGALGLWTVRMLRYLLPNDKKKVFLSMGDTDASTLSKASSVGCDELIHWDRSVYEEYLIARTKSVCPDGVDIIIDYSSAVRTVHRAFQVLAQGGVLVVGGHSQHEIPVSLRDLARKQQNILGVSNGTKEQLQTIITLVDNKEITPCDIEVYPVDQADDVFSQMQESRITGRAVLCVTPEAVEDTTDPFTKTPAF